MMSERGVVTTIARCQVEDNPAAALARFSYVEARQIKRFATLRSIRTAHELQLPAGTADMAVTIGFRGGLACRSIWVVLLIEMTRLFRMMMSGVLV